MGGTSLGNWGQVCLIASRVACYCPPPSVVPRTGEVGVSCMDWPFTVAVVVRFVLLPLLPLPLLLMAMKMMEMMITVVCWCGRCIDVAKPLVLRRIPRRS